MGIANFSVVVAGVNLPADTFDLTALRFRRQQFKEMFRAPVALQAEAAGAQLRIVPERFELIVTSPDDMKQDTAEAKEISNSIFDYTGPKSIKAIGHNMQYVLDGTHGRKIESLGKLINGDGIRSNIHAELRGADVTLVFRLANETQTRAAILGTADGERIVLDLNMNFEGAELLSSRTALNRLDSSLDALTGLAQRIEEFLTGGES